MEVQPDFRELLALFNAHHVEVPGSMKQRPVPSAIKAYYERFDEAERLSLGPAKLEHARTQALLRRFLPPSPAVVLDVGGGPGIYACWLARAGYTVHLLDPVSRHVEQAEALAAQQPDHPLAGYAVGDARTLLFDDESADAVLLLGPLYHLLEQEERIRALREARRVLRPESILLAAVISRFASTLDGLFQNLFDDPAFARMAAQDLSGCCPTLTPGGPTQAAARRCSTSWPRWRQHRTCSV